ncbi:hypothetical protein SAMN02745126_03621 [Enhydrobacter aerosaccus]|uniref:Neurotransmitter-gated ion-channel ligand binding domain-containing protein n=1 Tax=Enhydrobacter aerosaccus TaxID=225324 RepID=A0A1T4R769_9HYPH|nr:hypothetical protein [Enhydrobacter aerosaccus]SKA11471.1 hypothetical protein SAMN02745126_03621 [Enhydrobacter aerosaccus]
MAPLAPSLPERAKGVLRCDVVWESILPDRRLTLPLILRRLLLWLGAMAGMAGLLSPALAADTATIELSMRLENISGFSTRDKTYSVDGTLWLAYDAALARALDEHKMAAIDLVRFQNLVNPWDSTVELLTRQPARLADGKVFQGYRFVGTFYSNDIDFAHFPFGQVTLSVVIEPRIGIADLLGRTIRVAVAPSGAELGARAGISGYDLSRWAFVDVPYKRATSLMGGAAATESRAVFNLHYDANDYAAAVKWVLPLAVVMLIMLLTPTLSSALISERLAVPPMILLSIALMQQSYRENLPAIPYLTFLDKLYAFSFIVTLAFFVLFIWAANALRSASPASSARQTRRINRVDLATQILAVAGYVLIVVLSV